MVVRLAPARTGAAPGIDLILVEWPDEVAEPAATTGTRTRLTSQVAQETTVMSAGLSGTTWELRQEGQVTVWG
jgi:hypothetical protein